MYLASDVCCLVSCEVSWLIYSQLGGFQPQYFVLYITFS